MAKKETPPLASKRRIARLFTVLVVGGALIAACGSAPSGATTDGGVSGGGDGGGSHGW